MIQNKLLFIGGIGGLEILLLLFLCIPLVLWLWALVDLLKSDFKNNINKLVWLLLIFFLPVLGAVLYLLIGREQKLRTGV